MISKVYSPNINQNVEWTKTLPHSAERLYLKIGYFDNMDFELAHVV